MKRGLVIGKFMPIHTGHIALIEFACQYCDEVVVSMSYTPTDPINPDQRFDWIKSIFRNKPKVKPAVVLDDFDDESLPLSQRTEKWATFIKDTYGPVDIVFSSEDYGEPFAAHLGVKHIAFDKSREKFSVSGSSIRANPFKYWDFIPEQVRPHFVKKVCFYGPESTGKSVMAKKIAEHYQTVTVPEVARELITSNEFNREDIITIGRKQTERIFQQAQKANKVLICDTDLITTQIYSRHYLGVVPPVLYEFEKMVEYDQYFLFDIDVPWVNDGLRDLGEMSKRKAMYDLFKAELERRNIPWIDVHGSWEDRTQIIKKAIDKMLASNSA